jgi:hypothetical protein
MFVEIKIVTRLLASQQDNRGSIPDRGKGLLFFRVQIASGTHLASYTIGY